MRIRQWPLNCRIGDWIVESPELFRVLCAHRRRDRSPKRPESLLIRRQGRCPARSPHHAKRAVSQRGSEQRGSQEPYRLAEAWRVWPHPSRVQTQEASTPAPRVQVLFYTASHSVPRRGHHAIPSWNERVLPAVEGDPFAPTVPRARARLGRASHCRDCTLR